MMQCENCYCVYWCHQHCMLEQISLDIQGSCQCCIYLEIEHKILDRVRQQMLQSFEDADLDLQNKIEE